MDEGTTPIREEVYFENIDIQQPELRIPSPQQSLWERCWQPIGTTRMDTDVLREPRGFMRLLEWFFAIVAFATCCNFTTSLEYNVNCTDATTVKVAHNASYPFVLGQNEAVNVTCGKNSAVMSPPGDFSSDAQFFVFTGVISFLSTMAILVIYIFFANIYSGDDKKFPLMDFCFTVVVAVFWLSASAAWANGLSAMKSVMAGDWIYTAPGSICEKNTNGGYIFTEVKSCALHFTDRYAGANISVILGFLNFFLWSANLWFLYKETSWFSGMAASGQQQMEG